MRKAIRNDIRIHFYWGYQHHSSFLFKNVAASVAGADAGADADAAAEVATGAGAIFLLSFFSFASHSSSSVAAKFLLFLRCHFPATVPIHIDFVFSSFLVGIFSSHRFFLSK